MHTQGAPIWESREANYDRSARSAYSTGQYGGHDLNRDWIRGTQAEVQHLPVLVHAVDPTLMHAGLPASAALQSHDRADGVPV